MIYIKKIINQDLERTPTFNVEAVRDFFKINLNNGESVEIKIILVPSNKEYIIRFQKRETRGEYRIFLNELFKDISPNEGDILLLNKVNPSTFTCEYIGMHNEAYNHYNHLFDFNSNHQLILNENVEQQEQNNKVQTNIALNQILFGPPGTGKTDATIEKALEILELKTNDRIENREIFRNLLNKKIFFVTLHPSYSYEDFVQGIKPKTSDKDELLFEPKPGIFKIVSDLARNIFEDDGEVIDSAIDNKDLLRIFYFLSKFNTKEDKKASNYFGANTYSKTFKIIGDKFSINPNTINNHVDKFDYLASEERTGWKPKNGSDDKLDNSEMWPYNDVYVELKDKSFDQVKEIINAIEKKIEIKIKRTEKNTNYVLILDEINRANISKVFGELITLLEEDKRIGKENELSVTLPSGEIFSVPPNLYIIGTMNTADKSIALVDIALRRRFQFVPIYPKPEIIIKFGKKDKELKKDLMVELNKKLIDQTGDFYKGVDFQIGHAYFLKDNILADVINENVIPLLTEYFRNDLIKIKNLMTEIGKPLDESHYAQTGLLMFKG
jgi:5-methylcytosine-specific restriction protein B